MQLVQAMAALPLKVPAAHNVQETALPGLNEPELQGVQVVAAEAIVVCDPGPHELHAACPEAPWYAPSRQAEHEDEPSAAE